MLVDFIREHKIIATVVTVLVAGFIVFSLYIIISRTGKEAVTIQLTPDDTILTINDEKHGEGTIYLAPGNYSVHAEREGFQAYDGTLEVSQSNLTTPQIDLALQPVSEEAIRWQEEHANLYSAHEGRSGDRATEFGINFQEQFPITGHLPFRNYIYSIGHRLKNIDNPSEGIVIAISAITGYREAALDKIRELGFEPTDYEIEFNDYENPFNHE